MTTPLFTTVLENVTEVITEYPTTKLTELPIELVTAKETTEYPTEITTGIPEEVTEVTSEVTPVLVSEYTTQPSEITTRASTMGTTTPVSEFVTVEYIAKPNDTIPDVVDQQFKDAGYPVDFTNLTARLPDTNLYTAFIPYSDYISRLPIDFIQDLVKQNTAIVGKTMSLMQRVHLI